MKSSKKLVLGIEGGGTKTEWVFIAHDGDTQKTVDRGMLPAANLKLIEPEALVWMFRVLPTNPTHVGAFLAGCGSDADRIKLRSLAQRVWPDARIAVGSDRWSGFAAAFGDGDGITVIAGTGSAVTGRRGGKVEKAGGWGHVLGDKGGGYHLALRGLRLALLNYDLTHRVSPLAGNILRELGLNRLDDLVDWAKTADKMSVAKLVPVVFAAARDGNPDMIGEIESGARTLAGYTHAVAQRLELDAPQVKLLGGLFAHAAEYVDLFKKYAAQSLPRTKVEVCATSGAIGAAWLAAKDDVRHFRHDEPEEEIETDILELAAAMTEQRNPRSAEIDRLPTGELIDLFVSEEKSVELALAACRDALAKAVDVASEALKNDGRIFYVGAGTSGRLGVLDASEIPPTFGAPPELVQGIIAGGSRALQHAVEGAEDQDDYGAWTMRERGVTARDVVCGLTASGRTPFVLGALGEARRIGAKTMLVTCNPARKRQETWDVEIDLPTGPELVTGSTRLKAGTATKLALNIISTCGMIRLGKVKGNLMIDLNVSNVKLRDRAVRLVSHVRKCSYDEAESLLASHDWKVRECL
jgi:N-acetylmuramic acid 6-phosphate etherase